MKRFISTVLLIACGVFTVTPTTTIQAATTDKERIGGDFTLTDHRGQPFTLQQERGKVVLLFFGYTWCPGICPESLTKMARVIRGLEGQADQVSVLFITVDPERDTVQKLSEYVPYFNAQLTGLTGSSAAIQQVTEAYRAEAKLQKKGPDDQHYMVDHKADIYALDRTGKVASIIPFGMPAQHILNVVQGMLEAEAATVDASQVAPQSDKQGAMTETTGVDQATPALESPEDTHTKAPLATFQLNDLQGKPYRLQGYVGKPMLINFWASWCPPCRAELPALNRAWQALKDDGMVMLAVNVGEKPEAVTAFLKDYPIDFPVLTDEAGESMTQWSIKGMPTTVILDHRGEIAYHTAGERAWDSPAILSAIRALQAP